MADVRSAQGACPVCGQVGLWLDERGALRCLKGGCPGPEGVTGGTPLELAVPASFPPELTPPGAEARGYRSDAPASPLGGAPPLGGHAPPLTCGRVTGSYAPWAAPSGSHVRQSDFCGVDATWHVIWEEREDGGVEGGLACDEHMTEIRSTWRFLAAHAYSEICSFPSAGFDKSNNACEVDERALGFDEAL